MTFEGTILQLVRRTIDYLETQIREHSFLEEDGRFIIRRNYSNYVNVTEMMKLCGIVRRKTILDSYIAPVLTDGSIERKYPEHPNHPKQMYSLTEKAKTWKKTNN